MQNDWLEMWNTRFGQQEYVYGTAPNAYLKEKLKNSLPLELEFQQNLNHIFLINFQR